MLRGFVAGVRLVRETILSAVRTRLDRDLLCNDAGSAAAIHRVATCCLGDDRADDCAVRRGCRVGIWRVPVQSRLHEKGLSAPQCNGVFHVWNSGQCGDRILGATARRRQWGNGLAATGHGILGRRQLRAAGRRFVRLDFPNRLSTETRLWFATPIQRTDFHWIRRRIPRAGAVAVAAIGLDRLADAVASKCVRGAGVGDCDRYICVDGLAVRVDSAFVSDAASGCCTIPRPGRAVGREFARHRKLGCGSYSSVCRHGCAGQVFHTLGPAKNDDRRRRRSNARVAVRGPVSHYLPFAIDCGSRDRFRVAY